MKYYSMEKERYKLVNQKQNKPIILKWIVLIQKCQVCDHLVHFSAVLLKQNKTQKIHLNKENILNKQTMWK